MTREEFAKKVAEDITAELGYKAEGQKVEKLQGVNYDAIQVFNENEDMAISLNIGMYYGLFENSSYEEVFEKIKDDVRYNLSQVLPPSKDIIEFICDYERVKSQIMLEAIPTERNREMLKDIPHKEIFDLSIIARVVVDVDSSGVGSIVVGRHLLREWNISEKEFFDEACRLAEENYPVQIIGMTSMLMSLMGPEKVEEVCGAMDCKPELDDEMLVCTNRIGEFGAGAIAYPGFLKAVTEAVHGRSFYILPSSLHELIIVVDIPGSGPEVLGDIVRSVNREQVSPDIQLSDNVYYYDAITEEFTVC